MATPNEKLLERIALLKKSYDRNGIYRIGVQLNLPDFKPGKSGWSIDEQESARRIAAAVSDEALFEIFRSLPPYAWTSFYGRFYTLEGGKLSLTSSWDLIKSRLMELRQREGENLQKVVEALLELSEGWTEEELSRRIPKLKDREELEDVVQSLEKSKVIQVSYIGRGYREWSVREELIPLVRSELGGKVRPSEASIGKVESLVAPQELDILGEEMKQVQQMNGELGAYVQDVLKNRFSEAVSFGRKMSVSHLSSYLLGIFGPVLYFDSLLAVSQQYGLADAEIVHSQGKTGLRTGFNLALFGEPGTGKSFSSRDMILGRPESRIPPHGVPGRNRYCGGITPARFIRIGQAYEGLSFNFIVPEFNDWFKYKGMVEPLKLAMERAVIKYETAREVIGPYRFGSYLSVNYNTAVYGRGYDVTVSDPNFAAIEDRMLCRLHRLTKERFVEIAKSQMKLALGEIDIDKGARLVRDHATLVYAAQTGHGLVKDRLPKKPVMITKDVFLRIERAREAILSEIRVDAVPFSARLEDRAIRLAAAMSMMDYFQSRENYIRMNPEALALATRFYVEEASVRSKEVFNPEDVMKRMETSTATSQSNAAS